MNKTKNNIITLVIIVIFLISIYIYSQKNKLIEKFYVEDYKGLKNALAIKMNINSRRITNLRVDGKINDDSINIKFNILPRNKLEANENSTTQVEQKIKKLVKEDLMNVNMDNEELFVKDITITELGNQSEKFLDSNQTQNKQDSSKFVNSTINNHIEYLKTKKNPFVYNDRYDRYWKLNKNMELELPPPVTDQEEFELKSESESN